MTIFSRQLKLSDSQVVTATAESENVIDLGAPGTPHGSAVALKRDIGPGEAIPVVVNVEASAGITSLQVVLQVSADEAFTTPKDVVMAAPQLLADIPAGTLIPVPDYIPQGTDERYMRLNYVVAGAGSVTLTAGVTMGRQTNG